MLQVDLTALSAPELRRLLNTTRERGQASLSYQILQEMAARRERGPAGLFAGRRPAESRVVAVDLDDPFEPAPSADAPDDDIPPLPPGWVPQRAAPDADGDAVSPRSAPRRGRRKLSDAVSTSLDDADPRRLAEPDQAEPAPEASPRPDRHADALAGAFLPTPSARAPRFSRWSGLLFAVGLSVGVASGWWASDLTRQPPRPAASNLAAPRPPPTAAPTTAAVQPMLPAAAIAAPVSSPPETGAAPPDSPASLADADIGAGTSCADAPTPADRTICQHPRLQTLQRDLRRAYADALMVHQDRTLLRQRQLAWREARNDVASASHLARLYDDRIRRLRAAAADARRRARRA